MSDLPSLPSPHEPFVDRLTGKVTEVWYRYLSQVAVGLNAASTGAAKAWGHVVLTGTTATLASGYNVATVASTATGYLAVGLTVPFASTSYAVSYGAPALDSTIAGLTINVTSVGLASTGFSLMTHNSTGGNADPPAYFFACYGDQ